MLRASVTRCGVALAVAVGHCAKMNSEGANNRTRLWMFHRITQSLLLSHMSRLTFLRFPDDHMQWTIRQPRMQDKMEQSHSIRAIIFTEFLRRLKWYEIDYPKSSQPSLN